MVEFKFSTRHELAKLDLEIHPKPAKDFMPKWYKQAHANVAIPNWDFKQGLHPVQRTIKSCPSMYDIFHKGWVFPAPTDIHLGAVKNEFTKEWDLTWQLPSNDYKIEIHSHDQFVDLAPDSGVKGVFKFVMPFDMYAPKGYSVMQLPMLWHFDLLQDWYVPYGIVDVDYHHEINPQLMFVSKKKEIIIKRGTPLGYWVPFKREKINLKYVEMTPELLNKSILSRGRIFTTFKNGYIKNRDNKNR